MKKNINILLIEDNPADARLMEIYLMGAYNSGVKLTTASTLSEGLELLSKHKFSIVLLDLVLPDSKGINSFRKIYNEYPEVPVIAITGVDDEVTALTAVKFGAQDFLMKSEINSTVIRRSVSYAIERHELRKQLTTNNRKLELSEYRLKSAQALAHLGYWDWNLSTDHFTWSEELLKIFGHERGIFSTRTDAFFDAFPESDLAMLKNEIDYAIRNRSSFNIIHDIIRKDGVVRKLRTKGELVFNSKGKAVSVLGISQDVSEMQREEELEKLAMVASKSFNAVIIADSNGKIEWVNEGFTRLSGFRLEDVKGTSGEILRKSHKTGIAPGTDLYRNLIANKKPISYYNLNYSKSGREYWALSSLTPVLDEAGNIHKIIVIDSDVTAQKNAEGNLRKTTRILSQVLDNLVSAVIFEDEHGKVIHLNKQFCNLFNIRFQPEEIIGKKSIDFAEMYSDLFPTDYDFPRRYHEVTGKRQLVSCEEICMEDGRTFEFNGVPIEIDNAYRGYLWLYRDFTAYKNTEEQLIRAKELAEDLMNAKQQFLANMSHEIRTPMNAILGLTEVLLKSEPVGHEREYLRAIKTSGDTLMVIINDILDLSKIESGKMILHESPLSIRETIISIVDLFTPKFSEKELEFEFKIDEKIPKVLSGDNARLNQVMMNLLSNAIKFTEQGFVSLHANLSDELEDTVWVEFTISDSGIGIAEDKIPVIFDSFTQADSGISSKYGGTGLGLNIVSKLIALQGGRLTVQSKLNKGSTFSFALPFKKCNMTIEELTKQPEVYPNEGLQGLQVLLVEDNLINQMLAEKILNDWGCIVEKAENGRIAIDKLAQNRFDLILMDIKMPEMDGYEATRYIRNKMSEPNRSLPILAMTAHAAILEAEHCIEAGMNDYLSKPFSIHEFYRKIIRLLPEKLKNYDVELSRKNLFKDDTARQLPGNGDTYPGQLFDLSYLNVMSKGNDKVVAKMVSAFIVQLDECIKDMKSHAATSEWDKIYFNAHKVKPTISCMGIKKLETLISDIEIFAKEQRNLEQLSGMILTMENIGQQVLVQLATELNKMVQR